MEKIFKNYDIRGIYPTELDEKKAYEIGRAFVNMIGAKEVLIGRDMRLSSNSLFQSVSRGVREQGADVISVGLVSTDVVYFVSGKLGLPGIMITASHNPPEYNGFKLCYKGAIPLSSKDIQKLKAGAKNPKSQPLGRIGRKSILKTYIHHLRSFISEEPKLKIVVDAGNGMAGKTWPLLGIKSYNIYFELDGSFPNHHPNPIAPKNLEDLQVKVLERKADVGLAFDGDADRVFFVNEKGEMVSSSIIISLIASGYRDEKIIFTSPCSKIVRETILNSGNIPVLERVGHSFIKLRMRKEGAVFGGEHSGHYYFRDNFCADSGLLAALLVLEIIHKSTKPFSEITKPLQKYCLLSEENFSVEDKQAVINEIAKVYKKGRRSDFDGLSVEFSDWWFNLRPSGTESLLRLNLEAKTKKLAEEKRKELVRNLSDFNSLRL